MAAKTDNYLSKFKPESNFFISPDAITQSQAQAFGPVDENEYRLTTKFTVSGSNRLAYAICKGVVLIQRQTGSSNKVNLILRPYVQPIAGFNIKYFVYRGLVESDFFNGDKLIPATGTPSDFITGINASFAAFYAGTSIPDFLARYIGFDPATQTDELLLSDFFFKESAYVESNGEFIEKDDEAFELPMVGMGKSLGNFAAGECGIDVVLNYGDYKLPAPNDEFVFDLAYARAAEAKITIDAGLSDYEKKVKREQIFQFLDAAAFFGFHYENGSIKVGTVEKRGADIYNDIVCKFFYKNRLYLYIQSDRGRSYNFYGNYLISDTGTESLKIGDTPDALNAEPYATNGWPVMIKDNPQSNTYLQLVTDNNENCMLYGQVANIGNAVKNNFIDAEHLKLLDAVDGTPSIFTKVVALSNAALSVGGNAANVAGFNIVIYQGKANYYIAGQETDEQNVTTDILAKANFFDDVFDLVNAEALFKTNDTSGYSVLSSEKLKLVNHNYNGKNIGISAVQTTNINDVIETGNLAEALLKRVTYVSETVDFLSNSTNPSIAPSPNSGSISSNNVSVISSETYRLPGSLYYSLQPFTDGLEAINGLQLLSKDGAIPNKIILGISKDENELLISALSLASVYNVRLFLIDLLEDGNELISQENLIYQKFNVGLVGENSEGELKLFLPAIPVTVYSLDRKYHFSRLYSMYMKEDDLSVYVLDLDVMI